MTSSEFNKKYGLSQSLQGKDLFTRVPYNINNFTNVAGKPKKLPVEIFKRFFSNWATVLFTIIFLTVLIISLVVTFASPFNPNLKVSLTYEFNVPIDGKIVKVKGSDAVNLLPPVYKEYVLSSIYPNSSFYAEVIKGLSTLYNPDPENQATGNLLKWYLNGHKTLQDTGLIKIVPTPTGSSELYVNAYKFYELSNIIIFLNRMNLPQNASVEQIADAVKVLRQANPDNPNFGIPTYFGTNSIGIDIWTSSWVGTWNAIRLALITATLQTVIGVAVGSYLGFHVGSKIDTIIMRLIEIFVAPPTLIWLLLFASTFGTSDTTLILALVFTGWTGAVGGTRMYIITVKDSEFITASKSIGASKARLIYKHTLPAIIGKIATSYVNRIPGIILSVSSLAFLGFFRGDNANLGALLSSAPKEASNNFLILFLPSMILLSISVSLHFIALGIHDALDPRVIRGKTN
ncbi:ABC transporter permease [Mycoplasma corogypsi]|uniref:ABC transporter permease n=1 Tax=Mycoplasma corogypsi TaxID=2106 RepID=UPI003873A74D